MERQIKVYEDRFVKWAADKPEVVVLSGDLTASTEIALFKERFPERFFSMGLAEQNMVSLAGGLAREGYIPFVHTFSVFLYRRAYDQVAMSVAYPNLPVRLVGFLPGVTTPGGVTHQAIEDIGVLRNLPNMSIVEPGDLTDVEGIPAAIEAINSPIYLRMRRGLIPRLFDASQPFVFGKARDLGAGDDICVLSSGLCTEQALYAVKALRVQGLSVAHLHVSTFKPFDDPHVLEVLSKTKKAIITIENHTVVGGLGSCVSDMMTANGIGTKLHRLGIQDRFLHGSSQDYLMHKFGLDALALVAKVEEILDERFAIDPAELKPEEFEPYVAPLSQLEAL